MLLIDQGGRRVRRICDRCRRLRATVKRGCVCEECRGKDRGAKDAAREFFEFATAYRAKLFQELTERRAV